MRATASVLEAMRQRFAPSSTWADLAPMADPMPGRENWVGPSGHLVRSERGVVFGFGKHANQAVDCADRSYLRWIQGQDFPPHVKAICAAAKKPD